MGVLAVSWAFRQRISGNEKVVLLAIADHADDDGKCWPSVPLIAEKACVSERTVQRILINLEEQNLVQRVARSSGDGRKAANLYVLAMANDHGAKVSPSTSHGDASVTGDGDSSVTGDGDNCVTTLKRTINKNHQKEPSNILVGASIETEFEEFWQAYPKRSPHPNPKHPAKLKYVNARKVHNVSHETLITAARAYADAVKGKNPEHIAQAVTWLNQRRWEDYNPDEKGVKAESGLSDEALVLVLQNYPGVASNREEAKRLLASEVNKGVMLEEITEAAHKLKLLVKQARSEGREMPVSIFETWIKFKWREMDAYEFYRGGMTMKLFVRPKKVK